MANHIKSNRLFRRIRAWLLSLTARGREIRDLEELELELSYMEAPITRHLRELEAECLTKTETSNDDSKINGSRKRRSELVRMESVSPVLDHPDTANYPLVLNAPSNASRDNILALRTAGPNSEIYFMNKNTGALILGDQLISGEMPVLSMLSQFPGMREEGPILPISNGSTEK